jgi:hypothetical protein
MPSTQPLHTARTAHCAHSWWRGAVAASSCAPCHEQGMGATAAIAGVPCCYTVVQLTLLVPQHFEAGVNLRLALEQQVERLVQQLKKHASGLVNNTSRNGPRVQQLLNKFWAALKYDRYDMDYVDQQTKNIDRQRLRREKKQEPTKLLQVADKLLEIVQHGLRHEFNRAALAVTSSSWVVTTFTAYHFFRLSELNSDSQSFNS